MSNSSSNIFGSGAVNMNPQLVDEFDKFAIHSAPKYKLGFKVEDVEGNVYRYAQFGDAVAVGTVVGQDISESSLGDSDDIISAAALAGAKTLTITVGNTNFEVAANQFAGGKFIVSDNSGKGYTYDIVSNTANSTAGSTITVTLKQPLQVALATTSDFIIVGSKFANLDEADITDSVIAGVSCAANTANTWGWVQTKGHCGILTAGTTSVGVSCVLAHGIAGAVSNVLAANLLTQPIIGTCLIAGDDAGYGAFRINLE